MIPFGFKITLDYRSKKSKKYSEREGGEERRGGGLEHLSHHLGSNYTWVREGGS